MHNEDSNQPAHLHILISLPCPHEETASLSIQNAPSETANAQPDLNLRCAHMSGTFSDVMAQQRVTFKKW